MTQQVFPFVSVLNSEAELATAALALGAKSVAGWSDAEGHLIQQTVSVEPAIIAKFEREIQLRQDPLGNAFRQLRLPELRRESGATYTPQPIVEAMIEWAATQGTPARVVDAGVGSGWNVFLYRLQLYLRQGYPVERSFGHMISGNS